MSMHGRGHDERHEGQRFGEGQDEADRRRPGVMLAHEIGRTRAQFAPVSRQRPESAAAASIEPELAEFAVLGPDAPHRAGDRAVDHASRSRSRPGGTARPTASAPSVTPVAATTTSPEASSFMSYFLLGIARRPSCAARSRFASRVEDQAALHLAADAAQRAGRQHALRRAARAEIEIDAGLLGLRGEDDAGDVAVGEQAQRRRRRAGRRRSAPRGAAGRARRP